MGDPAGAMEGGKGMSDVISREEAIEAIEEYADRLQMVNWKENPGVPYKVSSLNWCINTIRDLPSIDAVKHGRWTLDDRGFLEIYKYICSECGAHQRARYDYCPSCGARMDGEDDE